MSIIKCKMCGGDLDITEGTTVAECEYCGTKQTVPSVDNEKKLTLFSRANRLRLANEFDKAAGVYESIVADFPEEAEAYWGLVLCRYGIEYVDDPATGKKIPTCHRSSFESVMEDSDFEQACENADGVARRQYREEAKQIEEIRKGIIEVSGKEEPYDIFICYKETDDNGDRTIDSVIAQDAYDALTSKGYRVFFSRISLEDKLGTEYEPYIFAALNSAKVMIAFGTDYEYYNAVWVKNEWSRFLKLMAKDKSKHLIPCYKGIDAYDIPKEFAKLQAQDMGKVGAMQDLVRGIEKILPREKTEQSDQPQVIQQVVQGAGANLTAQLKRGNMALEDGEWDKAEKFFDAALNMDAECAEAYLGLAMAKWKCHNWKAFAGSYTRPDSMLCMDKNAERARMFGSEEMKAWFDRLQAERAEQVFKAAEEYAERAERERKEAAERAEQARKEAAERAERERKEAPERIKRLMPIRQRLAPAMRMIAAGYSHTVGLKSDGTVVAVGRDDYGGCRLVEGWKDVVAIAAGDSHNVGLKSDGAVVAVGKNYHGQCNVRDWKNVVAIAAGRYHTVGLKSDGTVVATIVIADEYTWNAGQSNVGDWKNVVAIAAGRYHTVGLKSDGTVVAAGSNNYGQCNIGDWTDIVAIAAGSYHTVGLKSDGAVVAVGDNENGECAVSDWRDIVAIAAGDYHTVGLKSDGTVVATIVLKSEQYIRDDGQCNVRDWKNVVAIAAGHAHTVGLKSDGTVIAVGRDIEGQCGVDGWKLFNSIDTIERVSKEAAERAEQARKEAAERAERERKEAAERAERERQEAEQKRRVQVARHQQHIGALFTERNVLNTELANLKGLFSVKRRKEIEVRLREIENELQSLNEMYDRRNGCADYRV